MLCLIFFDAVKRKRFVIVISLFLGINPPPRTARAPSGRSSHIYNLAFRVVRHESIAMGMRGAHVWISDHMVYVNYDVSSIQ